MDRPDGLGVALRFAISQSWQGRGYAVEAASAALRFGHERAELSRIVAVARASNFDSRTVLGAIGMKEAASFIRDGEPMVVYESVA
jgi:RimJ/RimL family protein N-acetyltransferase